jgi:multidrug efflux pump subunit AcrA (membrane-fusion protein)
MKKLILLIVVVGVIAAGWFLYFNNGTKLSHVSVCEAEVMDLENTLEFSGEVVPQHMYTVMSITGGEVAFVYVSEGTSVSAGQKLFEMDKTAVENQLKEAKLNARIAQEASESVVQTMAQTQQAASQQLMDEKAKIALALSQTTGYDYESFNAALSEQVSDNAAQMAAALGDMSLADIDSETATLPLSDSEVMLANLAVEQLEDALEDMSFSSRIDGTVISVNVHKGEVLMPGVPAMVIADTKNTSVTGYVYERDVSSISEGMDVKIHTEKGYYKGVIDRIGDAAMAVGDTASFENMAKVSIIPDDNFGKMPGAIVDIEIILSEKSGVVALPIDCLMDDKCVFVVGEGDVLERRSVTTGFEDTFNVEITGGVYAGETVVISPDGLEEGQQVTYDRD